MKELTVLQMVRERLIADGYDGLVEGNRECACLIDDLASCSGIGEGCTAGYRWPCDCGAGCDFHIVQGLKYAPDAASEPQGAEGSVSE